MCYIVAQLPMPISLTRLSWRLALEFATNLAVNLRKQSMEQQSTEKLQAKLREMKERLAAAEAGESSRFKKHTKLQAAITAIEEVLEARKHNT